MRQTYRSFVLALASAGALALLVAFVVPSLAEADVSAGGAATATPTATPPALQPPAAPTNLDFGGKGLVWDDNSDDEDGFRIYKTVGGGAPEVGATLPADTTSAPVPALTVDEPCAGVTFTVVAFNAAGESAPTLGADILQPLCDPAPDPPAAPTNLRFEGNHLVWDDNSNNENGFRIYKTVGGGAPEIVATLPADTTSAPRPAVSGAEACDGTTFTVVAFNAAGESAPTLGADILGPICDRFPFPFPPDSGSGPAGGPTATRWLLVVAGVGLALIALGVAALRWDTRLAGGK